MNAYEALKKLAIDAAKLPGDRGQALDRHDLVRARLAELERGRDALLQACDTIEQIALSEGDMALDTDDIRRLLADGALADGTPAPVNR